VSTLRARLFPAATTALLLGALLRLLPLLLLLL